MAALISKVGLSVQQVARILCTVPVGERIPTVSDLVEMSGASRGNVQKALEYLKESGVVRLQSHGHQGTNLLEIDHVAIARVCGINHLVGAMPLPYTRRYEGLATGLYTLLNEGELKAYISFMRGSEARVQSLMEGLASFCVMSSLAYGDYVRRGTDFTCVMSLGPRSYVGRHVLICADGSRRDWNGARVGIDYSSADQRELTEHYFARWDVEYVPVQYTQIVEMLRTGYLDVGIWNEDDLGVSECGLTTIPLTAAQGESGDEGFLAFEEDTTAVIVTRGDDPLVGHILQESIDVARLADIQNEVMSGRIPARY